jgi:predicted nucleotidyltransferase component of viral defense system
MKYADAASFRRALEQRIKNQSSLTGLAITRLRKQVALDQLLRRFAASDSDSWVLKGAVALDYRFGTAARFTNDLDMFWKGPPESVGERIRFAQKVETSDYFTVVFELTSRLDDTEDFSASRYRAQIYLGNRRFETVTIDIGFDGELADVPDSVAGPALLEFAEIRQTEVLALPLAQHVAEKVHAYSRIYADSRPSSRVKDLVDLVIICSQAGFQAHELRRAIRLTFEHRRIHEVPAVLHPPPEQWRQGYARIAEGVGLSTDLHDGHALAAAFLNPILSGNIPDGATWNPATRSWGT